MNKENNVDLGLPGRYFLSTAVGNHPQQLKNHRRQVIDVRLKAGLYRYAYVRAGNSSDSVGVRGHSSPLFCPSSFK
jgi:hypothetical protein